MLSFKQSRGFDIFSSDGNRRWQIMVNQSHSKAFFQYAMMFTNNPQAFDAISMPDITKKILLVDDNADLRDLVADLLRFEGYEVSTADDGLAGLREVDQKLPDIILSDIRMPHMDGIQMRDHLLSRPETRDIPILFISAFPWQASERGLVAMPKPVKIDDLLATLSKMIGATDRRTS